MPGYRDHIDTGRECRAVRHFCTVGSHNAIGDTAAHFDASVPDIDEGSLPCGCPFRSVSHLNLLEGPGVWRALLQGCIAHCLPLLCCHQSTQVSVTFCAYKSILSAAQARQDEALSLIGRTGELHNPIEIGCL